MSELIVDWPHKPKVKFAFERNTTHVIYKTREERYSTWYTSKDKKRFEKNALRDAQIFRCLKNGNREKVDYSLCENRVCSWGLEKTISKRASEKAIELRKGVRRAVFVLQEYGTHSPDDNVFEFSDVTGVFNKTSSERAFQIGLYYERRVRELSVLP